MKVLVAPDKFKGSLTAEEVCEAIAAGVREKIPGAEVVTVPLADGGEGTADILTHYFSGRMVPVPVAGPFFEPVTATYGVDGGGTMAFIEMAKASGLQLIKPDQRNPLLTTTLGTGELLRHALDSGATKVMLGIGGSGTNDAGIGMAAALGFRFLDKGGKELLPTGANLIHLDDISSRDVHPRLREAGITALCDVNNPLHGPSGAAFVYGPQKGADPNAVQRLDDGLKNFDAVVHRRLGIDANFPGAGAGGGIGSGCKVFLEASMRKGIDFIMETLRLQEKIESADLVITGEGRIDAQTLSGKLVAAVARLAAQRKKKVVAVCGRCELREGELSKIGIYRVVSLTDPFTTTEDALRNAQQLIRMRVADYLAEWSTGPTN